MGKIIKCLSGAVLTAALSMSSLAQEQPKQPKQPAQALDEKVSTAHITTEAIARELNKHDKWLLDILEQDYTDENREKPVGLLTDSLELKKMMDEMGLNGYHAAYSKEDDQVIIPRAFSEGEAAGILDALDHEVGGHVWWDHIPGSEGYEGPSIAEITSYCEERVKRKDLDFVRTKLKIAEDYARSRTALARASQGINTLGSAMVARTERFDRAFERCSQLGPHLDMDKFEEVRVQYNAYVTEIQSWHRGYKEFIGGELFTEFATAAAEAQIELSRENLGKHKRALELCQQVCKGFATQIRDATAIFKKSGPLLERLEDVAYDAGMAQIDAHIEELKKQVQKNPANAGICRESIESMTQLKKTIASTRGLGKMMDSFQGMGSLFDNLLTDLVDSHNTYQINEILNNPEEVYSRIVDATASLYFGEPTETLFPPNAEDLNLLERCGHRKIVSKYRLGKQMIEDGWNPDDVRAKLEYAERFEYKGRQYNWPSLGIVIEGKLPERKVPEFEAPKQE